MSFLKKDIEKYFNELAVCYKNNGGKKPIDIFVCGGCAVLLNYESRGITPDIDVTCEKNENLLKAIKDVAEKFNLSKNWIDCRVERADPAAPRIHKYSKLYKNYGEIINVYILDAIHLIAMKIYAERASIRDKGDVVLLLLETRKQGINYTLDNIKNAVIDLYDNYEKCPAESKAFLELVLKINDLEIVKDAYYSNNLLKLMQNNDIYEDSQKMQTIDEFTHYLKILGMGLDNERRFQLYNHIVKHDPELSDDELELASGGGCGAYDANYRDIPSKK